MYTLYWGCMMSHAGTARSHALQLHTILCIDGEWVSVPESVFSTLLFLNSRRWVCVCGYMVWHEGHAQ